MSRPAYCKMCDKYHFDRSTYYDVDINETIYFCSDNHKNEYLNKKSNPNYKTSQDKFMDEMNEKRENEKEERHRKLKDIEDFYENNPDGDYNNQTSNTNSSYSSERDRLIDIQEDKAAAEKEAKETAARKQRADELRSQGKNFQAFLVEFQNGIIGVAVVAGVALFFYFFTHNEEVNKQDAMKINSELELIEDSVKIYITNKNYDRALILTNKLIHTSHEDMENLEFDAWNGYPKFDEYWTKKKAEYKTIIFNKGTLNLEAEKSPEEKTSDESGTEEKKTNNNEKPKVQKESKVNEEKIISTEPDNNSNSDDEELDDEYKY